MTTKPSVQGHMVTPTRRSTTGPIGLAFLLVGSLVLTACGDNPSAGADTPTEFSITCRAFARPDVETSTMQARTIKLGPQAGNRSATLGDFRFRAQFVSDEFEGKALDVFVYPKGDQDPIAQGKYQFDDIDPPSNQFVGDHGFTGLIYVMHPQTEAELQYFCKSS